jgi:hypothetical protein
MAVDEIFAQLGQHMIQGLMVHTQLADYFCFLGLKGYHKCHEYHYFAESKNYRELSDFYLCYFNKFITDSHVANPQIIPNSWYKYTRQQVDASTRKNGIIDGFEKWVNWEKETLSLYQNLYKELINLGEIAAAEEVRTYLVEVGTELASASQKQLELREIDFNIADILMEQEDLYKKYEKKIKEI